MVKNSDSKNLISADKNTASNNNDDIQVLRAVAALLVVVDHAGLAIFWHSEFNENVAKIFGHLGALGVYIFFIISGYLMVQTNSRSFGSRRSAGVFMLRRFMRIAPIYYIGTLVAIFVLTYVNRLHVTTEDIVKSYLFIAQRSHLETDGFFPVLGVGWTLNMEMFFYAVFSIGLMFRKSTGTALTLFILVSLVIFGVIFEKIDGEKISPT